MRDNYFFIITPLRGGTSTGMRPDKIFKKSGDKKWTFENFSKIELLIVFCENLVAKSGLLRKFQ